MSDTLTNLSNGVNYLKELIDESLAIKQRFKEMPGQIIGNGKRTS